MNDFFLRLSVLIDNFIQKDGPFWFIIFDLNGPFKGFYDLLSEG